MVLQEKRDFIADCCPEAMVFDNPSFDKSIIGTDSLRGVAIYDYNKMIEEYMADEESSYEDAVDWIEYNTLRTIPYMGEYAPIVLLNSDQMEFLNEE